MSYIEIIRTTNPNNKLRRDYSAARNEIDTLSCKSRLMDHYCTSKINQHLSLYQFSTSKFAGISSINFLLLKVKLIQRRL